MNELFYNGTILTMNDEMKTVEAVFVEDGIIKKCGKKDDLKDNIKPDTILTDLKGCTLMPSFIDGHSHFSGLANSLSQCNLSQAKNFSDIISLLKTFIEENHIKKGQWVCGTNYDHNFLAEKRHPDKFVLDQVSTENPIVIIHASSHMGVVNSLALSEQGLKDDIKDPDGGRYGRVDSTQELNGYMEENAFINFRNRMPMPNVDDLLQLFQKAQTIYAQNGITTIQEGMVTKDLLKILQYAQQTQALHLDLVAYLDLEHKEDLPISDSFDSKNYTNHLRIGGYKIFLDGSPQGRTAWMKHPYKNASDGYCGYPIRTDEELYQLILTAVKESKQLLAHCNGDAAAEQYVTQFEKVMNDHKEYTTNRPVMIHAQFVEEQQLKRMKELDMIPSFFVAHTYYWGDIHIENLGYERAKLMSPAGAAVRLKMPFTFHQDSPVLMPNTFETIWCATNRVTKDGVKLEENERVSTLQALKANTIYAAYQYGEEDKKGSIEEGKLADLMILNTNPLDVPIASLKEVCVLKTIKSGKIVYER